MFIDIHTHILPFVDDGSDSINTTLEMLKIAENEGISEIIATPHFIPNYNSYDGDKLDEVFRRIKEAIIESNININLYLGNEIFLDGHILDNLKSGQCKSLASSRYILLELPLRWKDSVLENIVYNLQLAGYLVVFAHIERYEKFLDIKVLEKFIDKGCLMQVNSSSLYKRSKSYTKNLHRLIEHDFVHIISSDCHNADSRKPRMKKAYEITRDLIGDYADDLFINNPKKIIDNQSIDLKQPRPIKKTWWGRG
jgi:protein-tyrosine phosphatase